MGGSEPENRHGMDIAHHSLDRYPGSCVPQCEKFWFQFAAKVKAETLDPTRGYGRRQRRRVEIDKNRQHGWYGFD